jgi:hypothetical protein
MDAGGAAPFFNVMRWPICADTGWVSENHPDRASDCAGSKRADVCACGAGMPCVCNPCGGIDEPPDYARVITATGASKAVN